MPRLILALAASFTLLAIAPPAQLYIFPGDAAGDWLGRSANLAGDVNNDGFEDIVVGATQGHQTGAGYARVYSGRDGSILHTFNQSVAGDSFGFSVVGTGDVDADGYDDLAVGAPFADYNGSQSGAAWVFSGRDGSVLHMFKGDATRDELGCVGRVGDVDRDGFADVFVGATQEFNGGAGYARLFSGKDGSLLYQFRGKSAGDEFGRCLGSVGDLDKDGYVELIVTAFRTDGVGQNSGSAYVFSSADGSTLFTVHGDAALDHFGASCASLGDVDGDTYPDFAISALQWAAPNLGYVRAFSGRDSSTIFTLRGSGVGAGFGHEVAGVGDVDGDGFADLIVGAPSSQVSGQATGSASVFSGRTAGQLFTLTGGEPGDRFGYKVSGGVDVNGDGSLDLVIGADKDDVNGTDSGSVQVHSVVVGAYEVFGTACGNPAPALTNTVLPSPGRRFEIQLTNLPTFRAGVVFTGLSSSTWGGVALPFNLTVAGMPGCTLYANGEVQSGFTTHTSTSYSWGFTVPNDAELVGSVFFNQGLIVDPLANPGGVITSEGGQATVGTR